MCVSSAFWKWNSGRRTLLNKSSLLASLLRPWIWDFEYKYKYNSDYDLGMGNWISDGDNDDLLFGNYIRMATAMTL